jgi:predicted O-methyltransferase YrrM
MAVALLDELQNKENHMSEQKFKTEEFRVEGEKLIAKIKELFHEGNIRRVIIKDKDGKTVMEIPVTIGVVGALIAPQLAAIGAIAALITEATIVVEKAES